MGVLEFRLPKVSERMDHVPHVRSSTAKYDRLGRDELLFSKAVRSKWLLCRLTYRGNAV
jgi:hypothetical protein